MPAAALRPPPVGNCRHRASAPSGAIRGARTLTTKPPPGSRVSRAWARSGTPGGLGGLLQVGGHALTQGDEGLILAQEVQRVRVGGQAPEQGVRGEVQVRHLFAVAVVVEADPELSQVGQVVLGQVQGFGGTPGRLVEVVAEGPDDGPGAVASAQGRVHQEAGPLVREGPDVGCEPGVPRNLAGEVVIEVADPSPLLEQADQGFPVLVQRDV